jgi:acyl-CoA thioesterase-1
MPFASPQAVDRRIFLAGAWSALAACAMARPASAAGTAKVVTILGDSITAGYGLAAAQSLPAQLQASLRRLGVDAEVRGAGVSGDTTAGGLARVDFSVQPDTSLCVVELGGNDLLQGLEPRDARANLEGIVRRLKARKIKVVLCGLRAPGHVNARYAREFDDVFPAVARDLNVPLYPDLLAGVEQNALLNQRDGIHPNPRGVRIIASRLAPVIAGAMRGRA